MSTEVKPAPTAPATTPASVGKSFRERIGVRTKPVEEKKDVTPPADVKPEEKKPAAKPPVAKKKPEPVIPPVAPASVLDAENVERIAKGVAEGLRKTEVKPEPEAETLSPQNLRRFKTLERMEKLFPETAGKSAEFREAMKKMDAYRADWESKNKGKKFNPDDIEHEDFLAANDVAWDDDLYTEALADLRAEARGSELTKPLVEKLNGKEAEEKRRNIASQEAPIVTRHQIATAKVLFNELGKDFEKVLGENGAINTEEVKRLGEENPIYKKIFPLAAKTETVAAEIMRIARGHTDYNPSNPIHLEIGSFVAQQEKDMMEMPQQQRVNEKGQAFATSAEWEKMTPAQREKHWTFNDADLSTLYAFERAKEAKKIIEEDEGVFTSLAEKRGYKKSEAGKQESGAPAKPSVEAEKPAEAQRSPSGAVAPRMAAPPKNAVQQTKPLLSRITGR